MPACPVVDTPTSCCAPIDTPVLTVIVVGHGAADDVDALAHRWPCPKQTNNGGRGCVTWREGCESGSKQAREDGEVAPRCAG